MATFALVGGGQKLTARLKEIADRLGKSPHVDVGFFEGRDYPSQQGGASVPMVAAIQEFGAPNAGIPPRPYFRGMIAAKRSGWGAATAAALKATGYDAAAALERVGETIAGQLRDSIIDLTAPPLSPVTVMLRGMRRKDPSLVVTGRVVGEAAALVKAGRQPKAGTSTKPLIDTGVLLGSVGHAVNK